MQRWEVEQKINDLEFELSRLTEWVETDVVREQDLDAKYDTKTTRIGSKSEIAAKEAELAKYKELLKKMIIDENRPKVEKPTIDIEKQEREAERKKRIEYERERLEVFQRVKKTYNKRKGQTFRKIADRLSGESPKWKCVEKYSQEELEFVLNSLNGNSVYFKNREDTINSREISDERKEELISKLKWKNFKLLLVSKHNLRKQMEIEKAGYRL